MEISRFWSAVLLIAGVGFWSAAGVQATPALQAEDTFTYVNGSIVGQSGGSGWSGAWINPYSQSPLVVSDGQLIYDGSSTIEAAGRALNTRFSAATASKVYILFDVQFSTQSGGGTPNLRLIDTTSGNAVTGGLGNNGYTTTYGILGSNLAQGGNSSVSLDTAANILFEIDYVNGVSSLWVGASAWDVSSLPTSGADATLAFAPQFDRLDLYVRDLNYFDNLRIYSTPVPESANAAVLVGVAMLGFTMVRRRSRPVAR
jgi:hypothetical protein